MKNLQALAVVTSIFAFSAVTNIAYAIAPANKVESATIKEAAKDTATTTAVKTKLLNDTRVHGFDVHVETINGVVYLTGEVPSEEMKAAAIEVAKSVDGALEVDSKLIVNPAKK